MYFRQKLSQDITLILVMTKIQIQMDNVVIVANGVFPTAPQPLKVLDEADFIICCDGATDKYIAYGKEPDFIIGDLDSIDRKTLEKYADRTLKVAQQENTDLMKALEWCIEKGVKKVSIVGATGGREDHIISNIFALVPYAKLIDATMYTDSGFFIAITKNKELETYAGQQVSLFPHPLQLKIKTNGLSYPLANESLKDIRSGTLNEALGEKIHLEISEGVLLVFRIY